jgi:hypothetical protein
MSGADATPRDSTAATLPAPTLQPFGQTSLAEEQALLDAAIEDDAASIDCVVWELVRNAGTAPVGWSVLERAECHDRGTRPARTPLAECVLGCLEAEESARLRLYHEEGQPSSRKHGPQFFAFLCDP